jgi:hypothetical protein
LRALKLPSLLRHPVPTIGAALQQARFGSSLQHLQRFNISLVWLLGTPPFLDLAHHGVLRSGKSDPSETLRSLTRLAAPTLECLPFELYLSSFRRTGSFDWTALDAFLVNLNASRVVFLGTIDYTEPTKDAFLREMLPRAEAAGVLQME